MPVPLEQEDLDELVHQLTDLTAENPFSVRDTTFQEWRDLLFRRRNVVIPGINLQTQFRDPGIEDNCHQFKNRIIAAPIRINVAARSQADNQRHKAQAMEALLYRYYHKWRAKGVFDRPIFDMVSLGIGWLYLSLNAELLPTLPDMEDGEEADAYIERCKPALDEFTKSEQDIFNLQPVDPATIYYTPDMSYVCQAAVVPVHQVNEMYAARGKQLEEDGGEYRVVDVQAGTNIKRGSKWNHTVIFYTITDNEWLYQCVGGSTTQMMGVYPNIFGKAFVPVLGEITGDTHPLYAYRPLVAPLYATTPYKNIVATAKLSAGIDTAQQRYAIEKIDPSIADDESTTLEVRVLEGGIIKPPDGYKITNPGLALGPDLNDAIAFIRGEEQRYGYPKVLGKPEEVTASSGYERAQQQDAVANLLDPPLEHFASAMSHGLFPAIVEGVKNLGVGQTVRNIKVKADQGNRQAVTQSVVIKPDDIMDADIDVQFSSVTTFTRVAMEEEGLKMMQSDLMTETEFITEVRGVDDLDAWREERDLDKIRRNAHEQAITDAQQVVQQMKDAWAQQAAQEAGVNPIQANPPDIAQPPVVNSDMARPDRGMSVPSGPGQAMPVAPTPPGLGEGSLPGVPAGAV